ncbi:VOC family protein [Tabrizicola sp.]|uniref:VOC family protein n=1 Tax=Tabrizicola sp. TaxID=2005166 RepID=UPI003F3ADEDB
MFKLNHVALTVADRERSAAFYGKYFGLTDRVHDDPHLLILAGPDGGLLALSEGKVPPAPPRTTHFGFQATSPRAVEKLRAAFAADGVPEAEWQDDGPMRVQVFDPDGYRVEAYAFD